LGGGCYRTPIEFPDRAYSGLKQPTGINVNWTTPGWFATLHIPLKRGRLFGSADRAGAPTVVLINETAARAYWPNEVPLRKRVTIGMTTTAEVIGVVGDVRQLVDSLPKPEVYIPYAQYAKSKMTMFVRTVGDPAAVTASVRRVAREVAPQYPVYDVRPMTARIAAATARARFSAVVLGLFAATALSLAVVGIYGVMSLAVTARTREIGVRMALGADPREVRRQVIDEGLRLVSAGAMVGLVGALASTRVLQSLLFSPSTVDPVTYGVTLVLLGLAAFSASWLPAKRASKVDPVVALRAD
jgi:putative ABC transport system permease protein